jgi:hypothetical protein
VAGDLASLLCIKKGSKKKGREQSFLILVNIVL